jgi:hypothetical protein
MFDKLITIFIVILALLVFYYEPPKPPKAKSVKASVAKMVFQNKKDAVKEKIKVIKESEKYQSTKEVVTQTIAKWKRGFNGMKQRRKERKELEELQERMKYAR